MLYLFATISAVSIIGIHNAGYVSISFSSVISFKFIPCIDTIEIDSTPAPTIASAPSATTRPAAIAMVCSPDEQNLFTVTPDVVTGQPAQIAASLPTFCPVAPSGVPHPIITSSISAGSNLALSIECLTA